MIFATWLAGKESCVACCRSPTESLRLSGFLKDMYVRNGFPSDRITVVGHSVEFPASSCCRASTVRRNPRAVPDHVNWDAGRIQRRSRAGRCFATCASAGSRTGLVWCARSGHRVCRSIAPRCVARSPCPVGRNVPAARHGQDPDERQHPGASCNMVREQPARRSASACSRCPRCRERPWLIVGARGRRPGSYAIARGQRGRLGCLAGELRRSGAAKADHPAGPADVRELF